MKRPHLTAEERAALSTMLDNVGPWEILNSIKAWMLRNIDDFATADEVATALGRLIVRYRNPTGGK